jgi:hypothetical protein
VTVFVEVGGAGHFGRNVIRGLGVIFAFVALGGKIIEIVGVWYLGNFVIELVCASEACALASDHKVRRAATSRLCATMPDHSIGFISIRAHIDSIFAGALNLECQIRRIDFKLVFVIEMADPHDDRPLRQLQLGSAIVEIQERNAGLGIHANRSRACLQLSA